MRSILFLLIVVLMSSITVCAQDDATAHEDRITKDVSVKYHTLKTNPNITDGLYQAFYRKKTVVAMGTYSQGKPVGNWRFFSKAGKPVQLYNYSTKTLSYEAPDDSLASFRYVLDNNFTAKDTVTKPIKIGGRYFGYLPLINLFKLPQNFYDVNPGYQGSGITTYLELLISPAGRLADYRVHIVSPVFGERVLAVKVDKLSDEDKTFYPATINGQAISSRIVVPCTLTSIGRLEI